MRHAHVVALNNDRSRKVSNGKAMNGGVSERGIPKRVDDTKAKDRSKKEQYATISVIGSGSCGTCKLVRSKNDGQDYVLKKIDIARCFPAEKRNAYQEVKNCLEPPASRSPPLLAPHPYRYCCCPSVVQGGSIVEWRARFGLRWTTHRP